MGSFLVPELRILHVLLPNFAQKETRPLAVAFQRARVGFETGGLLESRGMDG